MKMFEHPPLNDNLFLNSHVKKNWKVTKIKIQVESYEKGQSYSITIYKTFSYNLTESLPFIRNPSQFASS